MFAGLFSSTKKPTKVIMLVDVGSGSAAAGLVRLNSQGRPTLLYSKREEVPLRLTRSGGELSSDILLAAGKAIEDVRKKATLWSDAGAIVPQRIEQVAFFLAAPWSSTSVKTIHLGRTKPFVMTQGVLERMLTEEAKAMKESLSLASLAVERTVISLRLNGYKTEGFSGAEVTAVEATLATTLAYKEFCEALSELVHNFPHNSTKTFHSFALPASHVLSVLNPELNDFLVLDIGSEVTEALVVREGSIAARATSPSGTNLFMRTLKTHAHMERAEAGSALSLASDDSTRLSADLKIPLAEAGKLWLTQLEGALAPIVGSGLPTSLCVFADDRVLPWLTSALSDVGMPSIYGKATLHIVPMNSKDLRQFAEVREPSADVFLLIETLFADSRFDEGKTLSLLSTQENLLAKPRVTLTRNRAEAGMDVRRVPEKIQ